MRVDLPDDQWADIIEPCDLRSGDLKAVNRAVPIGAQSAGFMDEIDCILLTRVITGWSLPLPLPRELPGTPEEAGSLDRLTIPTYKALVAAIQPHLKLINEEPDPKHSSESAGTSKDSPSTSESSSPTS